MEITVCIGRSCHERGSRKIIEELQYLLQRYNLLEEIDLIGKFCMADCEYGICVALDGERFSLTPDAASDFFFEEVLHRYTRNRKSSI